VLHEELDNLKVKNYSLGIIKKSWVYIPTAFYRLYRLLRKEKYDILNTWLFHASVMSVFAAKFTKISCLIESRQYSDFMYKYNLKVKQILDKIASHGVDHIIACSDAAKETLTNYEKVDTRKITVIYNGTSIDKFRSYNIEQRRQIRENLKIEDKIVLSYTAHLRPEKGHKYLLEAISEIKDQYTNVVLLLMGDGVLRSDLDALTRQLNIEDKVRFLGYRKDIPELLSAADIYVHTSVVEGFGIAIIEAMAIGLPVVATNVGGIPEIITNGENGILVPPENPQALAKAIVDLIEHPEKRKILVEKGKQHVKANFTYQIMVKEYMQVYNNAISKGKQHTGKN
jgi:glycosyltransferase involved in cell wall biosynthesis